MNKAIVSATVIAGIVMLTGLSGCGASTEVQAPDKDGANAYVSPGKGQAAVTMSHRFSSKPAVGESLQLELIFVAGSSDVMLLEIHADDALAVNPVTNRQISDGQSVIVDINPRVEGRHYVNVVARLGSGVNARARVFSIPVQVGIGGAASTAEKAETGPDGERLIRMPAQDKQSDQGR